MDDKLSIKVNVADRYYPLKIDRADEEKIRKAAKMINERVVQYQQRYADKDAQDFMAMASLQFVIKLLDSERKFDESPIFDDLDKLDREVDEYLKTVE